MTSVSSSRPHKLSTGVVQLTLIWPAGDGRTRCAFVPVFVVCVLRLDLGVYRVAYGLVGPACRVLVDDRGALAAMSHPGHQIPESCTAGRCECVSRMPEVMEVQSLSADGLNCVRPARHLVGN